ncbi:MAG TPA: hypothetical protein VLX92_14335 [Kofleriaceae bacterium]|nr:hypothetical protein [Kofleriaceae bacterium]
MKQVIASLVVALCATAHAQQAPKDEKAGSNESLQNGTAGDRPWARGVADSEQQAALELFHQGNVELNDGLFAKAAEQYKQALKHWDHPAIHYNLALAEMNLDQRIDAFTDLTAAVKYGDAPLQSKDKYDNATRYLGLLDKEIADIEVSCDKPGAKVTVDGKEAFVAPGRFSTKVLVGKHTFVAEKQGYTTRINAPYIGPGEHFRIELKLYTAEELTRYHRKWQATWIPYAVGGGAVVLGAIAGGLELSAQSSYRDYDNQVKTCPMPCANTPELKQLRDSGDTKRAVGYVGYGVAAATLVTAGVLWWIDRPEAYQIRAEDLQNEQVTIAPVVAPTYAGAAVQGHF